MTSWKDGLQLRDLDGDTRLEITCKACGHVHYLTAKDIMAMGARATRYLDEVESRLRCKARGCEGRVRLAMTRKGETSGFVGGMA